MTFTLGDRNDSGISRIDLTISAFQLKQPKEFLDQFHIMVQMAFRIMSPDILMMENIFLWLRMEQVIW